MALAFVPLLLVLLTSSFKAWTLRDTLAVADLLPIPYCNQTLYKPVRTATHVKK